MRVWLPYVETGTGTDVFTRTLAGSLAQRGHDTHLTPFSHGWQYVPWRLRMARQPEHTQVVVANSWNAFAFKRPGTPLVSVEHLLVLDPALAPYRSFPQAVFHNTFVRYFERRSATSADTTVAVSAYTADQLRRCVPVGELEVIPNGVDTGFFRPAEASPRREKRGLVMVFVGSMSKRKGSDLLAPIMEALGPGYELRFTGEENDAADLAGMPGVMAIGSLDRQQIRTAYQQADLLLFPSRLEGLPLVVLEAMACGTPVVASNASSIGEVVIDGQNGRLCPVDDVEAFAAAIRQLSDDPERLTALGRAARRTVEAGFSVDSMIDGYLEVFERMTRPGTT